MNTQYLDRNEAAAWLREVKSFGVLYGGRRLGKSSLLSQIEREVEAPPSGR